MANSVDPDQTAPIGAVCSGSTLYVSVLNLSVMLGNYLQQTTSADNIFICIFVLGALRVKGKYSVGCPLEKVLRAMLSVVLLLSCNMFYTASKFCLPC